MFTIKFSKLFVSSVIGFSLLATQAHAMGSRKPKGSCKTKVLLALFNNGDETTFSAASLAVQSAVLRRNYMSFKAMGAGLDETLNMADTFGKDSFQDAEMLILTVDGDFTRNCSVRLVRQQYKNMTTTTEQETFLNTSGVCYNLLMNDLGNAIESQLPVCPLVK